MDEIASLRRQLATLHGHLLTVEEQEVEFIDPRSIPPDLAENGQRVRAKIKECKDRLAELEPDPQQNSIVEIPIVIVAMTKQQATELVSTGGVADVYTDFQNLSLQFPGDVVHAWVEHYTDDRENWHPHTCTEHSIRKIVSEIVSIDSPYNQSNSPATTPRFCTKEFFSDDDDVQDRIWREMETTGGVMIIDAISLFHPDIRQTLKDSELMSNANIAIVVMSPIDPTMHQVNQLLEDEFRKRMKRAFTRFHLRLDKLCEVGVGDLRSLKRWLVAILPEAAANAQGLQPSLSTLERTWGNQRQERRNIHKSFGGQQGGVQ